MWEEYRKTLKPVQALIATVTAATYFGMHRMWFVTAVFFLVMQVGALMGALWAQRLRRKVQLHG